MVTKVIKVTNSVKQILNDYDANDLIKTVPHNYRLDRAVVYSYAQRVKPINTISITLTTQILDWLTAMAQNNNLSLSLVFNFLVETVADCGKINSKKIKQALDCYYYAVANDRELASQILSEYALSSYYEKTGLSEEGVAYFLATSNKRTRNIK